MVQNKYEARATLGRWAELKFQLDALENGLVVYAPVQSYPHVDCVVGNGSRLFRVQVKASSIIANHGARVGGYRFWRGGCLGTGFTSDSFDVLAGLCADTGRWVFAWSHQLGSRTSIWLTANCGRQSKKVVPWTDWTIFTSSGSHQPAHQLTGPLLQPSPEL